MIYSTYRSLTHLPFNYRRYLIAVRPLQGMTNSWYKLVQCLPLESVLLAVDMRRVDLFVLDVEGAELDILNNFNFNKFEIDVRINPALLTSLRYVSLHCTSDTYTMLFLCSLI